METPEQQRIRLQRKRIATTDDDLVACLECGMKFVRVGSHVVQVHGYNDTAEYRKEYGLAKWETTAPNYRKKMRRIIAPKALKNLEKGAKTRHRKGGEHGERVKEWWERRRKQNRPNLQARPSK